jgi:hypothetical protein
MGHVAGWWPLDDIRWLGFKEKLMGNVPPIAGNPNPYGIEFGQFCNVFLDADQWD